MDLDNCRRSLDCSADCCDRETAEKMSVNRGIRAVALLGSIGSVLALLMAAAAPCCLPIFAAFAGVIGLTALGLNEQFVLYAVQGFALVAFAGLVFSVSRHRQFGPLIIGGIATAALLYSFHVRFSALLIY